MTFKVLTICCLLVATSQAFFLTKGLQKLGLDNILSVDGDARVNVLGHEVGADVAVGVGGDGIGGHAVADADVLGQKANLGVNLLDGKNIGHLHDQDHHHHRDHHHVVGGWQEDGSYLAVDPPRVNHHHTVVNGGWQPDGTYIAVDPPRVSHHQTVVNGGWQADGTYIAVDPPRVSHQHTVVTGGWQPDGSFLAVDPPRPKRKFAPYHNF